MERAPQGRQEEKMEGKVLDAAPVNLRCLTDGSIERDIERGDNRGEGEGRRTGVETRASGYCGGAADINHGLNLEAALLWKLIARLDSAGRSPSTQSSRGWHQSSTRSSARRDGRRKSDATRQLSVSRIQHANIMWTVNCQGAYGL